MTTRDTNWPQGSPAWVKLSTPDLREARQTYGHLFGWSLEDGSPESGGYVVALKNGRPAAGVYEPETSEPAAWLVYFAADDVDATVQRAVDAGGSVTVDPADIGTGTGRFAVVQDPTGASVGIWHGGDLTGLQVVDEPGSFVWTTLLTRDLPVAQDFYAAVFGFTYEEVVPSLLSVRGPEGQLVGSMHQADQLPEEAPAAWNVHFCVASRDATVSLAEMEDVDVLMTFDTPFGPEAVLRTGTGETFNVTETTEQG